MSAWTGATPSAMGSPGVTPLDVGNHELFGVVTTLLCCMPVGAVALIYVQQAKSAHAQGRQDEAQEKLNTARTLNLASVILGGFVCAAYVALQVLVKLGYPQERWEPSSFGP